MLRPPVNAAARLVLGLRRLLLRTADAIVPPPVALVERIGGIGFTMAIHAAARLRLADLLAAGPRSAEALAAATGSEPDALARTLRGLVAGGLFRRDADGRYRNNRLSRGLAAGAPESLRNYAVYFGSAANVGAWADFDRSVDQGGGAFERVHGANVWDWFDRRGEERAVFAGAMGELTELYAATVATRYPWGGIRRLCDVGGGRGTLLAEILHRHRAVTGVLVDRPGVLDEARPYLAARRVAARVELAGGDFFVEIPAGCDGYLLKNVLHDFDDQSCRQILAVCRRAMAPGNRLLLVEMLLEADDPSGLAPLSDLQMMVVSPGGRERTAAHYGELLAACGLRLKKTFRTASPMYVLEAVAVQAAAGSTN